MIRTIFMDQAVKYKFEESHFWFTGVQYARGLGLRNERDCKFIKLDMSSLHYVMAYIHLANIYGNIFTKR